jgi:EREBP-like factor
MCGGAILSDLIPPPRRVTAGDLWLEKTKKQQQQKKKNKGARRLPLRQEEEDDFEADFEEFEVDSGEWEVESDADEAKPLAAPRSGFAKGKTRTRDLGDKSELFLDFGWPRFFFLLAVSGEISR